MDLDPPVFRYHPNPIASGSIVASGAQCVRCEQRRGFIYAGPSYCEVELDVALCPWCIADGSAHEKFDASFVDEALARPRSWAYGVRFLLPPL